MLTFSPLKVKITFLLATFGLWTIIFTLQKPVFLLLYAGGVTQALSVMWHGLPLDFSMSGYLSAVPALLLLVSSLPFSPLHGRRAEQGFKAIHRWWTILVAIVVALSFVANCALYGYWHFPLDSTPIFFITSSPKDAMASIEWWQGVTGVAGIAVVTLLICGCFRIIRRFFENKAYKPVTWRGSLLMLVMVGLLFLPIRGGITVASMNTGKVYFSENAVLNHAAVNPLFSFMENMMRQNDFASQYRFMSADEARRLTKSMLPVVTEPDTTAVSLLNTTRPDIYLVILESFSDTIMKIHGVTPNLNRMAREGVYFSRFYANSFRTDRGLVSILQGYPSPATVSLMKYPKKTANIPSLAEQLAKAGWDLSYYYGGDADFTNMRSFLVNQGFDKITEDVDFPIADRLSKWGVPDHLLFKRVEEDLTADRSAKPVFRVIQTSSSHEPFDVPYSRLKDKALNAFAYTDSCLGGFVDYLKTSGRWDRSLVIFIPDHLGAWPEDADNFAFYRFHVPMIWTGGVVTGHRIVDTFASQQDFAATLLAQLGVSYKPMRFSKDIFNTTISHFAFFMMSDGFGLIDDENGVIYDNNLRKTLVDKGMRKGKNVLRGQAYTQTIFDDIATR